MNKTVLLAWIGNTDLRASRNELPNGVGPLASAVGARQFSIIHLLTNQNKKESTDFVKWLKHYTEAPVTLWHKKLSGPTHFGGIYEAVCEVIDSILEEKKSPRFTFHLSPGTPAMAAVWIILAKTSCPAELIESSLEDGVKTVSIPFELAADYTPARTIENSAELMRLSQGLPPEAPEFHAIVHRCLAMKQVIAQARRIAPEDVPLLIQGESGTGKELFARAVHASSNRKHKPFIEVNCGAIPAELVESEFFGHEKGAFTGATSARGGYLESAEGGTLFLDEIGELPLPAQVKLLRALQEKKVTRVGGSKTKKVDFRVIAATNRSLIHEVAEKRFREDLFHRLAVGVIQLPPLRDRAGDLNLLIDHLLEQINTERESNDNWTSRRLSAGSRNLLNQHTWPGNIRELSNTLCRAAIWSTGTTIDIEDVQQALFPISTNIVVGHDILNRSLGNGFDLQELMSEVACHYLERAYQETNGNKTAASKLVGLPNYQTFTNWMTKYGVEESL